MIIIILRVASFGDSLVASIASRLSPILKRVLVAQEPPGLGDLSYCLECPVSKFKVFRIPSVASCRRTSSLKDTFEVSCPTS